jgi:hypothetical protein
MLLTEVFLIPGYTIPVKLFLFLQCTTIIIVLLLGSMIYDVNVFNNHHLARKLPLEPLQIQVVEQKHLLTFA